MLKWIILSLISISALAAPATKEEIADLYRTVLEREQDAPGAEFWLKSGLSIEELRKAFLQSPEYLKLQESKAKNKKKK